MTVQWIQVIDGRLTRGDGSPPATGDVHLRGETEAESAAIRGGKLHREGQPVTAKGQHRLKLKSGDDLVIDVDAKGKAKHRIEQAGGGQVG